MTLIDSVAVASLVLAIVAILFAWRVDVRDGELNSQFIQKLQKMDDQVESIKGSVEQKIGAAWDRFVLSEGSHVDRPSDEIVELTERIRSLETSGENQQFPAAIRNVIDALIQKVDKVERVENRMLGYLLLAEAAKAANLPPESRELGEQTWRDRKRFLQGEEPFGDILEVMVSPEELLGIQTENADK